MQDVATRRSPPVRAPAPHWPVAALLLLAAVVFSWRLGGSSIFVDESNSLIIAGDPLDDAVDQLRRFETSPPAYFVVLRGWLGLAGTTQEWVARLPSVASAIAVVAVTYRLATVVATRTAGIVAGLLVALSPLVLGYAQQARPYAMLMLAATVAVLATVEAERRRSLRWLAGAGAACVAALWLHYIAVLVVGPLALWLLLRGGARASARLAFCGVLALAFAVWTPLLAEQYGFHPNGGLGAFGDLTAGHALRVAAAPFDPRYASEVTTGVLFGAAVLAAAAVLTVLRIRRGVARHEEVVLVVAAAVPLALLVAAVAGKDMLVTRYASIGVPCTLVLLAAAITRAPRPLAAVLLLVGVGAALAGSVQTLRPDVGFLPDSRQVAARLDAEWQRGDTVVSLTSFGPYQTLRYYTTHRHPRVAPIVGPHDPRTRDAVREGRRLWYVLEGAPPPSFVAALLPAGYAVEREMAFGDGTGLVLVSATRGRARQEA